jgi:hypothetical protein
MRSKDQILLENLYTKKILNEGRKQRLFPMFEKIIQKFADLPDGFPLQYDDSSVKSEFGAKNKTEEEYKKEVKEYNIEEMTTDFQNLIKNVSILAKKENLVLIILKKAALDMETMWKDMENYGMVFFKQLDEDGEEMTSSKEEYEDYLKRVPRSISTSIQHWLSLPIPKMQTYLNNVSPNEQWYVVARTVDEMENEWKQSAGQWINVTDDMKKGNIKEFINFGNMGWFTLMRPYCEKEGKAMGHCGNKGAFASSDTVLSLREMKKQKDGILLAKPYLTFILKSGEYLGEMKGRANTKPKEEYHPYIIKLLTHKENGKYLIKNIEGGGYMPQNNFDIEDLSYENLVKLTDERPDLMAKRLESYFNGLGMIAKLKKHNLNMGDYEPPEKMIKAVMNSKNKDKVLVYFPKAQREAAEKNQ